MAVDPARAKSVFLAASDLADPVERVRHGLGQLYAHYAENEAITTNVVRDSETDPLVREVAEYWTTEPMQAIRSALLAGWSKRRVSKRLTATLDLALSFRTWQSLVRGSGLTSPGAADLMAATIGCCAPP